MDTHYNQTIEQFYSDYDRLEDHNDGTVCPEIPGTMCEGIIEGTFIKKFNECESCGLYQKIIEEDREKFIPNTQ